MCQTCFTRQSEVKEKLMSVPDGVETKEVLFFVF